MNEQDIYMEQVTQEADRYAPVSTGAFFWHRVLYGIPVIGWILCLVFSFTHQTSDQTDLERPDKPRPGLSSTGFP